MLNDKDSTQALYNRSATQWIRKEASSLSDFTARPVVLNLCEPVTNLKVLDLGCGEGYCSRELRQRGAKQVFGIDLSEGMIEAARRQISPEESAIQYEAGCATSLKQFADHEFDLVIAVFLFNYLTIEQMQECMSEVVRVLRPNGKFVFSIPHPAFPYMREAAYPFYFQVEEKNYFSGRNKKFPGRIWKRDQTWLDVQLVHKTLQDYFDTLNQAGFSKMPVIRELKVLPEHVSLDEKFFGPLVDLPLHIAFQVSL